MELPFEISGFPLPGKKDDLHIIPLSGGADSTALAIVMRRLFPDVQFRYVFTDTKAEDPIVYDTLNKLETLFDIQIERVDPGKGLIELCESWGGFLPGHKSRYCTKNLKAKPFHDWLNQVRQSNETVHTYVGIRADEDRVGLISHEDWIEQHMPFKILGLGRAEVYSILSATVGIPMFYRGRTRSGCVQCPFQTQRELIASMRSNPAEFAKGEEIERAKLSDADRHRWPNSAIPIEREGEIGRNHLSLPVPEQIDARSSHQAEPVKWIPSRRRNNSGNKTGDLFGAERMVECFVLGEFFIHPGVGDHGIWWQDLISFSRTRAGIQQQAEHHWWHRLATAEVFGLSESEIREELKLAIFRLHLPADIVDVDGPEQDSYTWKSDIAYSQLRHVTGWVERTLHVAGLEQEIREYQDASPKSWRGEHKIGPEKAKARISNPVGELLGMGQYLPKTDAPPEEAEHEVTCFQCAI